MASCLDQELDQEEDQEEEETSSTTVDFNNYEKMPTDTNGWVSKKLDAIKEWVALEKVHGANLSFTAQHVGQDVSVKVARRNAYLNEGENFFSMYQQKGFVEGTIEKVKKLFEEICKTLESPVLAVTVYGELFGGCYPHPDVPAVPKLRPVQREVVYCPDLRFMAYDIAVIHQSSTQSETEHDRMYLDYDICVDLFKSCELLYAEPLVTGTLQDMLGYPLGWDSKIPAKLGFPPLPADVKNPAEGIVVKPMKNVMLETERDPELVRVIFKRKIDGFRETKPREKISKPKGKTTEYNQDYELVKCEMFLMVTQQRLVNTISKLGLPDSTVDSQREVRIKWNSILSGLAADVLEEMETVHEDLWKSFKREQSAMVGKLKSELKKECGLAVKEYREHNA